MLKTRLIPVLLLIKDGLYKTKQFKNPTYIGDPINCVRIFNEKEVDELIFLDINATPNHQAPQIDFIKDIASECFMPFSYGGGIHDLSVAERILANGSEKIILNSILFEDLSLVEEMAKRFGSQSVVASLDVKKRLLGGYTLYSHGSRMPRKQDLLLFCKDLENAGVGELMITSIDREGTQKGCDLSLIKSVVDQTSLPVIAHGGIGKLQDMGDVVQKSGVSAVAAGSFFVFQGRHNAVLITYPSQSDLSGIFG